MGKSLSGADFQRTGLLGLVLACALILSGCLGGSGSDSPKWPGGPSMPDLDDGRVLPVVFVHGTAGSASQYQTQAMRFASNGYPEEQIVAFEYSTADTAAVLAALNGAQSGPLDLFVNQVRDQFNSDQVYLACHSLGTAVCGHYLTNQQRADKVAAYVAIDGATGANCPGDVPCMGIFVDEDDQLGEINTWLPDETHVQVATSEASFAAQFEFLAGVAPIRTEILAERDEVEISGRAVYFPANTGASGSTLQVWELDADTGERVERQPLATFSIDVTGNWGPVTLDPEEHYEFSLLRPGRAEHHFYRQPLIRNSSLVRLNTSPAGSPIEANTNVSDRHASLVITRDMEWWTDRGGDNDVLTIATRSPLSGDQPAINILSPAMGDGNIGIHVHDDVASPQVTSRAPLPYFPGQPFQWGVDVYMPANSPADGSITAVSTPHGDRDNRQTLNVPNLRSSEHRISLIFNDYIQH